MVIENVCSYFNKNIAGQNISDYMRRVWLTMINLRFQDHVLFSSILDFFYNKEITNMWDFQLGLFCARGTSTHGDDKKDLELIVSGCSMFLVFSDCFLIFEQHFASKDV